MKKMLIYLLLFVSVDAFATDVTDIDSQMAVCAKSAMSYVENEDASIDNSKEYDCENDNIDLAITKKGNIYLLNIENGIKIELIHRPKALKKWKCKENPKENEICKKIT